MTAQDVQPDRTTAPGGRPRRVLRPGDLEMPVLAVLAAVALGYGFLRRDEGDLTPELGVGYAFGIIGSLLMLTLLIYPLRKRIRALRVLGNIRGWFRIHMILGVVGPVFIILHSNFAFGSLNSTAAMLAMLVVAGSGFVGRFLYSGIHRGLYGKRQSLKDLLADVERTRVAAAEAETVEEDRLATLLAGYEAQRVRPLAGFWGSLGRVLTGPFSRVGMRRQAMRAARDDFRAAGLQGRGLRRAQRSTDQALGRYFHALGRAEAFTFYERLFAAWHLLHLPLFAILVLAAIAHVIAVHLY